MRWSPNRVLALYLGLGYVFLGLLGYFAAPTLHEGAWTVFKLDIIINLLHIIMGAIGVLAVFTHWSRWYNRSLGIFAILLGVLGLIPQLYFSGLLLGVTHINLPLNLLHLLTGLVAFVFGFFVTQVGTWTRTVHTAI